MKTAFVFPGQGAQYAGMGREVAEKFPVARAAFDEANAALDFPISRLCFEGPEEDLKLTQNTQPAILTTSIALFRVLEEKGVRPDFVAGHSLGEYSALVVAGALRFADAVRIVRKRGEFMQEAVPVGTGAMAAIMGIDLAAVEKVCVDAAQGQRIERDRHEVAAIIGEQARCIFRGRIWEKVIEEIVQVAADVSLKELLRQIVVLGRGEDGLKRATDIGP